MVNMGKMFFFCISLFIEMPAEEFEKQWKKVAGEGEESVLKFLKENAQKKKGDWVGLQVDVIINILFSQKVQK